MDAPRDGHTEQRKSEREKYGIIQLICGIQESGIEMGLFAKQKQSEKCRK